MLQLLKLVSLLQAVDMVNLASVNRLHKLYNLAELAQVVKKKSNSHYFNWLNAQASLILSIAQKLQSSLNSVVYLTAVHYRVRNVHAVQKEKEFLQ